MDQLALMHRIMVLMMGRTPNRTDTAFVFGRAQGDYEAVQNDDGILETVATLYHRGRLVPCVIIPNQEAGMAFGGKHVATTFPGTKVFRERLEALGVHEYDIVVPGEYEFHTRGEGDAYVRAAKERGWKSAIAIMNPHQGLRTMLGLLKSFALHQHPMTVVPVYPSRVNWEKSVYGSQGELVLPRHQHIEQEWDRIIRYQAKGDLASFGELNDYLTSCL